MRRCLVDSWLSWVGSSTSKESSSTSKVVNSSSTADRGVGVVAGQTLDSGVEEVEEGDAEVEVDMLTWWAGSQGTIRRWSPGLVRSSVWHTSRGDARRS